jgi:hypothetical protein
MDVSRSDDLAGPIFVFLVTSLTQISIFFSTFSNLG